MEHDFQYVSKNESMPVKKELINIINQVQNLVRDDFTFRYDFVGSAKRGLITRDMKSNIGYDFDVNIEVNDPDENFTAKEIKNILRNAFNKVAIDYGYDYCEDSTRVLTIKFKDRANSRILHSCDFAIVHNCNDTQLYIKNNKSACNYTWECQGRGFLNLDEKEQWIKTNNLWEELKYYYLYKKNNNEDKNKHSRSIYAETVHEICQKYGYNK